MIRDFIEHLKWGLRVCHFEHVSKRGPVNDAGYVDRPISPDLVEQLRKFTKKRGCLSLIVGAVVNSQEATSLPPDDRELAGDLLDALLAEMADRDLKMLESLEPRLREALACASRPGQETCLQFESIEGLGDLWRGSR